MSRCWYNIDISEPVEPSFLQVVASLQRAAVALQARATLGGCSAAVERVARQWSEHGRYQHQ